MANSGPGISGSQFFLTVSEQNGARSSGATPFSYSIIGHMTAGLDVAQKINTFGLGNRGRQTDQDDLGAQRDHLRRRQAAHHTDISSEGARDHDAPRSRSAQDVQQVDAAPA